MKKILITGATSGVGLEVAKELAAAGHHLLIHGRSKDRVEPIKEQLSRLPGAGPVEAYAADLSDLSQVAAMAEAVTQAHSSLDVLLNNAGVYKTGTPRTAVGLDVRFLVNTVAPYLLMKRLLPLLPADGRVVGLSSAAQSGVDLQLLQEGGPMDAMEAYAESKLGLTMWSCELGRQRGAAGPVFIAVNPGSLLATKMVREGWGIAGNDIGIGVRILERACLSPDFADATGRYFDNDARRFGPPHPDAMDRAACQALISTLDQMIAGL